MLRVLSSFVFFTTETQRHKGERRKKIYKFTPAIYVQIFYFLNLLGVSVPLWFIFFSSLSREYFLRPGAVQGDLCLQIVDAVKLLFRAQVIDQAYAQALCVKIAVEIEQNHLEHDVVAAERGPDAEVGDARKPLFFIRFFFSPCPSFARPRVLILIQKKAAPLPTRPLKTLSAPTLA